METLKSNDFSVFHRACKIYRHIEAYNNCCLDGKVHFMNTLFGTNQKVSQVYRHYDTNRVIAQARESRSHQDPNFN